MIKSSDGYPMISKHLESGEITFWYQYGDDFAPGYGDFEFNGEYISQDTDLYTELRNAYANDLLAFETISDNWVTKVEKVIGFTYE